MRLLLVEDNAELARLLTAGLAAQGFAADVVETAADARLALGSIRYSALILDLGLPDEDGMTILKELRRDRDPLPVLVLTARGSVDDRVQGLRAGADDYLVKPFALEELVARLQALMRRPGELLGRSLSIANLVFDTESHQIFVDNRPELFSARESAVLELLMRRQGRVVTKKAVEDQIFGMSSDVASNAVEVYVSRLRKHLVECRARLQIHTIRGVGYMIAEDSSGAQT
ncbi:MAG TPA: response regulator transcription factor [Bradyrhizobium sp.]|nr:response regulator transcription factor [Bradyrhizobium sp.]